MLNQEDLNKVIEHLKKELSNLRTNRATPTLVENIMVDAYGVMTPLSQVASISAPEPKTLVIQPWDKTQLKAISTAIEKSNLGINPIVDQDIVRLNLPALTEEKRTELVKIMKEKLEESRISVRRLREESNKKLKTEEKEGSISEDDCRQQEKETQEYVDTAIKEINEIGVKKEEEIMTV